MKDIRIGYGYDVHRLTEGESLILGGVHIKHSKGLAGHSDADVLIHAIIDALFGALALGDIGRHFPDDDLVFKDADSRKLLKKAVEEIRAQHYEPGNIDVTIVAERPKLASHIDEMRANVADDLSIELDSVSVKATTSEKMGFEGKEEGITARAVALIYRR